MPIIFFTKQQVGFVRRSTYCENLVCQFLRTYIYIYISNQKHPRIQRKFERLES